MKEEITWRLLKNEFDRPTKVATYLVAGFEIQKGQRIKVITTATWLISDGRFARPNMEVVMWAEWPTAPTL